MSTLSLILMLLALIAFFAVVTPLLLGILLMIEIAFGDPAERDDHHLLHQEDYEPKHDQR